MILEATFDEPLSLARREREDRVLTIIENGAAYDLSADTIVLEVEDEDGTTLFSKNSASTEQIEISEPESGLATVHFVGADTVDLDVGGHYWLDVWVYRGDGRIEQVITRRRLHVRATVHEPDTEPPVPTPPLPLVQNELWQRFDFTWPADSDTATIDIPSPMRTGDYTINYSVIGPLPSGGAVSAGDVYTNTTTTSFDMEASGELKAGTVLRFTLEDM